MAAKSSSNRGHRWFAAFWERVGNIKRDIRSEVAAGARGRVLEIGAGTGFNFQHYSDSVEKVVAIEPDPYMLQRAERRAEEAQTDIEIQQGVAEALPFEDASFDVVVSTLTMCSVSDPRKALSEVYRVLKPGGQVRFYEHVLSGNRVLAAVQHAVTPLSRWLGAGCHQDRDTVRYIEEAGFEVTELRWIPVAHVAGVATKRS